MLGVHAATIFVVMSAPCARAFVACASTHKTHDPNNVKMPWIGVLSLLVVNMCFRRLKKNEKCIWRLILVRHDNNDIFNILIFYSIYKGIFVKLCNK